MLIFEMLIINSSIIIIKYLMKTHFSYKLTVVFLLIINFNCFCSISTMEQSILGEFNLLLSSEKKALRNLSTKTIKSHTANLFSTYGYVDTLSFLVYITDEDEEFKSLTSKNIPAWAVGVAKGNKIVIKSPTQKSTTYDKFNKTLSFFFKKNNSDEKNLFILSIIILATFGLIASINTLVFCINKNIY